MKILGIDTATDVCGIALTEDRNLITEYRSNIKRAHAERLISSVDKVLSDVNLTFEDLTAIALSIGPGSFTGLRIGLSAVKGFAFAMKIPVIAVNTLDALAYNALFCQYQICSLIIAQADEAYMALYQSDNFKLKRISDYQLVKIDQLNKLIKRKTLILNGGIRDLKDHVEGSNIIIAPEEMSLLSGAVVAQLGFDKFNQGEVEDIETLEPFYLKEFKAKLKSEHKH